MTAPLDLAPIRARAEAATPGPWRVQQDRDGATHVERDVPDGFSVCCTGHVEDDPEARPDAAFIAHARTDVPILLAEVARLARLYGKAVNAIKGQARAWRNAAEADRLRWEMTRAMANEVVAIPLLAGTMLRTLADNALGKAPVMDDGSDWPRWLLRVLADPLIEMMERVPNFFEAVMTLPGKRYVLTIMHEEGKTPATMLAESRAEVARLADEVERLRERLSCARAYDFNDVGLYAFGERWRAVWPDGSERIFDTLDAAWAALDAARKQETTP